ncbi:MAG: hypothetical protein ACREOE_08840 [Gemmatimonadales bacterium]
MGPAPSAAGGPAPAGAAGAPASWRALGTLVQLVVTDPRRLAGARRLLTADLAEVDAACSRFRADGADLAGGHGTRGGKAMIAACGARRQQGREVRR